MVSTDNSCTKYAQQTKGHNNLVDNKCNAFTETMKNIVDMHSKMQTQFTTNSIFPDEIFTHDSPTFSHF